MLITYMQTPVCERHQHGTRVRNRASTRHRTGHALHRPNNSKQGVLWQSFRLFALQCERTQVVPKELLVSARHLDEAAVQVAVQAMGQRYGSSCMLTSIAS